MHGPEGCRTAGWSSNCAEVLKALYSLTKSPLPKLLHPGQREPKKYRTEGWLDASAAAAAVARKVKKAKEFIFF